MITVKATFQEKSSEVDRYFRFLKAVTSDHSELYCPAKRTHKRSAVDEELKKVLKAGTFLMLYNLVESSMRGALLEVYDRIAGESLSYQDVCKELKKIWVIQRYQSLGQTAHPDRYRDLALELIEAAVSKAIVELDASRFPRSGNLNAERIRGIANALGFSDRCHKSAKGGEKLETVRDMRNKLAHGLESFAECGRSFTYEDLEQIKKEVVSFLRSMMTNVERYLSKKKYLE